MPCSLLDLIHPDFLFLWLSFNLVSLAPLLSSVLYLLFFWSNDLLVSSFLPEPHASCLLHSLRVFPSITPLRSNPTLYAFLAFPLAGICRSNYSLRFLFFLPFRFLFPPALALIMQIQIYRSSIEDDDDCCTYTLTFNIEFPHDNDSVYFAHSYPYTYSDLQVIEKQIEIPLGFHFPSNHLTYCYVWIDGNNLRALHSIQQLIRLYSHKIGLFDGNTKASN